MSTSIKISRSFLNKKMEKRSLDTNFINTMTVLSPQVNIDKLDNHREWFAFEANNIIVFRYIRFSREFYADEKSVCVDHNFCRSLGVRDGDEVLVRKINFYDRMRIRSWIRSLTPALRIVLWFTIFSLIAGSVLGGVVGWGISKIFGNEPDLHVTQMAHDMNIQIDFIEQFDAFCRSHNLKVVSSNLAPATNFNEDAVAEKATASLFCANVNKAANSPSISTL